MSVKKISISIIVVLVLALTGYYAYSRYLAPKLKLSEWESRTKELTSKDVFKEGDIIFQASSSRQTKAIQLATHSQWSHVGIILKHNNELFVYEAVQPVKFTPLAVWLSKSLDGIFAVKRLINSENILNTDNLQKIRSTAEKELGKNYDIHFGWSDEKLYCSEYIWKIYDRAVNIRIGNLQKLRDFDLTDPEVKKVMEERYGSSPPLEEDVISPVSIFNSDKLKQIYP